MMAGRYDAAWAAFVWPSWIPDEVRRQIAEFQGWHMSPEAWLAAHGADNVNGCNDVPPLGLEVGVSRNDWVGEWPAVKWGRFVWAWNNIGRLVHDDGTYSYCAFGNDWKRTVDVAASVVVVATW